MGHFEIKIPRKYIFKALSLKWLHSCLLPQFESLAVWPLCKLPFEGGGFCMFFIMVVLGFPGEEVHSRHGPAPP